jgi:hypothetical protein
MERRAALAMIALAATLALAGSARAAGVLPASKDYGSRGIGTTSAPATFQLETTPTFCTSDSGFPDYMCISWVSYSVDTTALGGGPGTTTTTGDFALHNVTCPYPTLHGPPTLAGVPSFCSFEASFAPIAGGPRSRTLSFPESPGGANASLTLTGTGTTATAPVTFDLKAAIKKCKKKFPKGPKRKKCIKKARLKAAG